MRSDSMARLASSIRAAGITAVSGKISGTRGRLRLTSLLYQQTGGDVTLQKIHLVLPPSFMSKTAFLFPGQGSQYPGMGKSLADAFPEAAAAFAEADAALGFSISKLCFEG